MKKASLLMSTLLVLTPVTLLLPGCGGGSSDGISPTPTSATTTPTTATGTPTSLTPTATVATTQNIKFVLSNGQKGTLNFVPDAQNFDGTIEISASKLPAQARSTRGLSSDLAPGVYSYTSSALSPGGHLEVDAKQNNVKVFQLRGTLPTTTERGTFVLQRGQELDFGPLYKIGEDFPSAIPTATPTRVPFDSVEPELTFKASSDSNFVEYQPYYADITPGGTKQSITLSFATSGGSRINGLLKNAKQGKVYTPTSPDISTLPILTNYVGDEQHLYTFQGGTIKVTILTKTNAQLTFENAVFAPKVGGDAGGAKGKVTVNGTIGGAINGDFIGG